MARGLAVLFGGAVIGYVPLVIAAALPIEMAIVIVMAYAAAVGWIVSSMSH